MHALLGQGGDRIIIDMLLESSIFIPLNADMGNYYQLSGMPISEIKSDGFQKSNTVRVDVGYEAVNNPSRVESECKSVNSFNNNPHVCTIEYRIACLNSPHITGTYDNMTHV